MGLDPASRHNSAHDDSRPEMYTFRPCLPFIGIHGLAAKT